MMAAAYTDLSSALYASYAAALDCFSVRRPERTARIDMTGDDLFGLISVPGWLFAMRGLVVSSA
jgi:hypothetical protein